MVSIIILAAIATMAYIINRLSKTVSGTPLVILMACAMTLIAIGSIIGGIGYTAYQLL